MNNHLTEDRRLRLTPSEDRLVQDLEVEDQLKHLGPTGVSMSLLAAALGAHRAKAPLQIYSRDSSSGHPISLPVTELSSARVGLPGTTDLSVPQVTQGPGWLGGGPTGPSSAVQQPSCAVQRAPHEPNWSLDSPRCTLPQPAQTSEADNFVLEWAYSFDQDDWKQVEENVAKDDWVQLDTVELAKATLQTPAAPVVGEMSHEMSAKRTAPEVASRGCLSCSGVTHSVCCRRWKGESTRKARRR